MGEKKGKALALELMDDLLTDDGEAQAVQSTKVEPQEKTPQKNPGTNPDVKPLPKVPEVKAAEVSAMKSKVAMTATIATNAPAGPEDEATLRISATQAGQTNASSVSRSQSKPPEIRVRASVGRYGAFRSGGPVTATEAALAQSETLRIAQGRLLEFETELERLRVQNEELAAAAETLQRRTDELASTNQKREYDLQNARANFEQEKELLLRTKETLQADLAHARQKNEEMELRISTNIQKIRVRERELENRLELLKMESAALVRNKDEMILDLKRQIDQLNLELNNYRGKNQELNRQTTDKQEMLRRTVKALRLALSMLEGEEEAAPDRKVK